PPRNAMLLQYRPNTLRVFTQHDHALLSGELARHWQGFSEQPEPLSLSSVLAITTRTVETSMLFDE
ncbi:MAG: DUF3891 family protein, partial [Cyanobacteria bacterium P01_D01_bin.73]